MNRKRYKRLLSITLVFLLLAGAISLVLYALQQNINLFYTPSQLLQASIRQGQTIRVGGYVKEASIHYDSSGQTVSFIVTDHRHEIIVSYHGVLPSLFRAGQGVVVTGQLTDDQHFLAQQVLAKHDEKYMPWPLAKALQENS